MNYELIYENDTGQMVVFGTDSLKVTFFEGFGSLGADVQYQRAPYQDGSTHVDSVFETRPLSLEFVIIASSWDELSARRRELSRVFNPKNTGKFSLSFGSKTYEIYVNPDSVPYFAQEGANHVQEGIINVTAPNPYWRSPEQITEPLAAFVPLRTYPTVYPVVYGRRGSEARLFNDGDVPCPVQIELTGPALSPVVTNQTTGEFIRITRELYEGDKLIINTANGQDQMVAIERQDGTLENAWHYIDIWESTLFSLDVGENVLDYDALTGQGLVTISFNKLYVGV